MRVLYLLSILLVISLQALAQTTVLQGKVIDASTNEPIIGANILVKKSSVGTISDLSGNFKISLEEVTYPIVLQISAVGYETQHVQLSKDLAAGIITAKMKEAVIGLNEVVISASRNAESIDEAPGAITVVGRKEITEQLTVNPNLADILTVAVPGLGFSTNTTSNTGQTLRGRNVLVLIDGIPQSTPLRNGSRDIRSIDPAVIERVEVIKGATAIYGNGADGGLINYITKTPRANKPFASQTNLSTGGSLVNTSETMGSRIGQQFYGKLDKFSYVVNGVYESTGVFRDAEGDIISPRYGLGETEAYNLFGKLNYQINTDQQLEVMYNYFSSNQSSKYTVQDGIYGEEKALAVLGEEPGVEKGTRANHNAALTYRANNVIGKTALDVNLYLQDFETIYDYSDFFENGGQSTIVSSKKGARVNAVSQYEFGSALKGNLVYGVDVLNDVTAQKLVDGRVWVPEANMTNVAPYVQVKGYLLKDFVAKFGARLENISIEMPDYTTIKTINYTTGEYSNGGVAVKGGTLTYDAFTFNAGLRYTGLEAFKPFISYSQGFSLTDLGRLLRAASENTVSQINSDAVIVNNYEGGFNSSLFNNALNLEASAYLSTSKLGSSYKEVNGVYQIERAPERVYGFELAADAKLLNNLFLGSAFAYVEGKKDGNDDGDYKDEEDTYLPHTRIATPKLVSYIKYLPLDNLTLKLQSLTSGSRDHFEPNSNGAYGYGEGPIDGYTIFNLYTSYKVNPQVQFEIGIENLLNKAYYTTISQWYA